MPIAPIAPPREWLRSLLLLTLLTQGILLGALVLNESRSREAEQGVLQAQASITRAEAVTRELILEKERLNAIFLGSNPALAGRRPETLVAGITFLSEQAKGGSDRSALAGDFLANTRAFQAWLASAETLVKAGRTGEATRLAGIEGERLQQGLLAKLEQLEAGERRFSQQEAERLSTVRWLRRLLLLGTGISTLLAGLLVARVFYRPALASAEPAGETMPAPIPDGAGKRPDSELTLRQTAERLTETLRQREGALQELAEELAAANRELRVKAEDMEAFIRGVSHDLRTPLVNIKGFSRELELSCGDLRNLLSTAELTPECRGRFDAIDRDIREAVYYLGASVASADRILAALRQLARAGHRHFEWQLLDVHEIVTRIVDAMHATIIEKGAKVVVHPLPPAWGDAIAMEQIFSNLLKNAIAYLDPGRPGHVEIGAQSYRGGAPVTYWVRDNGIGIPAERQAKIFTAFQRIRADLAEGEGIGLALVHRSVLRLGGQIRVESQEGVGSTFFITLQISHDRKPTPLPFPIYSRPSA